jgi:PII-like signaling protein
MTGGGSIGMGSSEMSTEYQQLVRLRIYLGEEKREGDQPLYQAIIRQARQMHLAGATVFRATQGFGRSTRLHTLEVLFSDDLPVVIEIIDRVEKIDALVVLLEHRGDIGIMTCEPVALRGRRRIDLVSPTAAHPVAPEA